jgi:hypothetical protein
VKRNRIIEKDGKEMELYDEIYQGVKAGRCSFLPLGNGYFQGVKSLVGFSDVEIVLLIEKNRVVVRGEGLEIKKYCDGDLELSGRILSVGVEKQELR